MSADGHHDHNGLGCHRNWPFLSVGPLVPQEALVILWAVKQVFLGPPQPHIL